MAEEDPDDFLMGGGVPSARFPTEGTVVRGKVLSKEVRQQRDMDTGEPKEWKDGRPMNMLRVVVQTDEIDPEIEDDNGQRAFYISYKMREAVQKAVKAAGASKLEIGGELAIKYHATEKPKKRGYNGAKLYRAKYTAPDPSDFLNEDDMGEMGEGESDADEDPTTQHNKPAQTAKKRGTRTPAKKAAKKAAPDPVDEFSDDGDDADGSDDDGF